MDEIWLTMKVSFEMEISGDVELHSWNHTCDKLEEDQQGEVWVYFLTVFSHCVGHCLEDICMFAGVDCGHHHIFDKFELFDRESLIQVFLLDIFFDFVVA